MSSRCGPARRCPRCTAHDACPGTGPCATGHVGMGAARHHRPRPHPRRLVAPARSTSASRPARPDWSWWTWTPPSPTRPRPPTGDLPGVRDGQDVLAVLADRHGEPAPGDTFTVATPSGGLHLYYRAPADERAAQHRRARSGWKVDTRAHGGYVVAPGSSWTAAPTTYLSTQDPAPLPAWLLDAAAPGAAARRHRRGRSRSAPAAGRGTSTPRCGWSARGSQGAPGPPAQRRPVRRRARARAARGRWRAQPPRSTSSVLLDRGRSAHRGRRLQRTTRPAHHRVRPRKGAIRPRQVA